jgi:hypothetical protein
MFYKYQVSYWCDGNLNDGCGIVFGVTIVKATEYLTMWYGEDCLSSLTLDAIDLDVNMPVLDFNSDYKVLEAAIEAVEQ